MKTVLLTDGSTGQTEKGEVGDCVTVGTADENGMALQITGEIETILEDKEECGR